MDAKQIEHEHALVAYYLVLQSDHPRNCGLGPEHFSSKIHRQWWAEALSRDAFSPFDLGMTAEDVADLSGSEYGWAHHIPTIIASVREYWASARLKAECKKTIKRIDRGDGLPEVSSSLIAVAEEARSGGEDKSETMAAVADRAVRNYIEITKHKGNARSLPMFVPAMQRDLGGWMLGCLHLVVARSSEHKTTFARQALEHIASAREETKTEIGWPGAPVLYWTMEDSADDIAIRDVASHHSSLSTRDLATGKIPESMIADGERIQRSWVEALRVAARPAAENFRLIDKRTPRLADIPGHLGTAVAKHGIKAAALDFAQLIRPREGRVADVDHWYDVAITLAAIASHLDIALIACVQVDKQATRDSKDNTSRGIRASDIYGGIAWMQAAYSVTCLWRSENRLNLTINVEKYKSASPMSITLPVNAAHDRIEVK